VPELPDVVVYLETLAGRIAGKRLIGVQLRSPFVLRSVDPPLEAVAGATIAGLRRIGKRIVLVCDRGGDDAADLFLVIHLMIAGRLRWRDAGKALGMGGKLVLAIFEFEHGSLYFTEAGTRKRASLAVVRGEAALGAIDRGGIEPLAATFEQFRDALARENHTLKRSLTDPRLFSGIGNAYSDEILHAARLSPLKQTRSLGDEEMERLYAATQGTLADWIGRLRERAGGEVPEKVTAFHDDMAVHGKYKQPCPVCGAPVQRIVYADNECNYCARCQTGGRLLADRSMSRLLKDDWPRSIDDLG
jgi:formamidopyrimidine-DNA glycosylase